MEERFYLVLNKQKFDVKYWAIEKTATWGEQGKWGIIEILTKNPKKKPQQKKDARLGFLLLRTFIIYTVWETGHMTHLHYESERQTDNTEALRDSILRTYRGKNIVLLVYSRHEKNTSHELDELEQLMRESESKNMVFLHVDISPYGLQNWHEAALKRPGEHYTGRITPFTFQPSDYYSTRQGGPIYYEFYSPDGTMTLSTYDKGIATAAIKKIP